MATGETMDLPAARAPAEAPRVGAAPAVRKRNVTLFKSMLDDDDDDSSDDDDVAPAKKSAPSIKGNDAAAQETRPRRHRGSRTGEKEGDDGDKKKKKTVDKGASLKEMKEEEENHEEKKMAKPAKNKTKNGGDTSRGVNVRSERLQLRAVMLESTATVAVVTPDEKAKKTPASRKEPGETDKQAAPTVPRKRRRAGSSEAVAAQENERHDGSVVPQEQTQAKRPRLTRQNSREAEKKEREAEEKAAKAVEAVGQERSEDIEAESDSHVTEPQLAGRERDRTVLDRGRETNAVPPKAKDGRRAKTKPSEKSAEVKHSGGADGGEALEAATAPNEVADASNKVSSNHKRRSQAVSDESDTEFELATARNTSGDDSYHHKKVMAEEKAKPKSNNAEAGETRKRLKRPRSASSSNGSKSIMLGEILDRESSGVSSAVREPQVKVSADKVHVHDHDKMSSRKGERHRSVGSENHKPKAHRAPTSSLPLANINEGGGKTLKHVRSNEDRRQAKSLKESKGRSDAGTLDDYIKERENRVRLAQRIEPKLVEAVEEPEKDNTKPLENGDKTSTEPAVVAERDEPTNKGGEQDDHSETTGEPGSKKEDVKKLCFSEEGVVPMASKTSIETREESSELVSPSEVNPSNQPENSSKTVEHDEEGAVSDHDSTAEQKKAGGIEVNSSAITSEGDGQADSMAFVIPKKRPATVFHSSSSPKKVPEVMPAPRQEIARETTKPGPSPSPESKADTSTFVFAAREKSRSKNAVPPKMTPLSAQEKDFFGIAKKSNSLLKAASIITLRGSRHAQSQLASPFGCVSDRYGVLLDSGQIYTEATTRMVCPTRKQIKQREYPPAHFGVAMEAPPDVIGQLAGEQSSESDIKPPQTVSCYETLDFAKAEDRDWYIKRMYGTTFVPQMLRERVTLVMRNARYVRKSTGLLFNAQRDKEEYAAQISARYTVNRTVPRCDILQKNWQLLVNGRVTFIFLHYMNREDALIARAQFRDDDGQPLIIKGETGRSNEHAVNSVGRFGVSPAPSPPPASSPQPRHRSRSRSNGRSPSHRLDHPEQRGRDGGREHLPPPQWQSEGGPRPPRDRSAERGRGRRRRRGPGNGPDARNGGRYGPPPTSRSPSRRPSRSRSQSPHRSSQVIATARQGSPQSSQQDRGIEMSEQGIHESQDYEKGTEVEMSSQGTLVSSQATTVIGGDESSSERVDAGDRRYSIDERGNGHRRRPRSRSRSRPRVSEANQHPPMLPVRRGSGDRSFQRDRRSSGEFFGHGRDGRRGQSPPPFPNYSERDRHGRDLERYGNHDQQQHQHHQNRHHQQQYVDRAPLSRDYENRGRFDADPYHRPHPRDDRRFH